MQHPIIFENGNVKLAKAPTKHEYARKVARLEGVSAVYEYPGTPYDVYTEVVAVAPGYGTADSLARTMDQWREGDVYCLELQALSDGEWYPLDHLCGVYGDQLDDVARDMARDVVGAVPCAA